MKKINCLFAVLLFALFSDVPMHEIALTFLDSQVRQLSDEVFIGKCHQNVFSCGLFRDIYIYTLFLYIYIYFSIFIFIYLYR